MLDPDDAQNRTALFNVRNVCLLHLRRFQEIDEVESEVHALATGVTTYGLVYAECIAGMSELAQGRLSNATATFEAALNDGDRRFVAEQRADRDRGGVPRRGALRGRPAWSGPRNCSIAICRRSPTWRSRTALSTRTPCTFASPTGGTATSRPATRFTSSSASGTSATCWRVVATAWAEQSRLALLQGDLPAADRYLQMAEANGPYSTLWDESSATLRARLLTAHGRPADALKLLDAELAGLDTETCRREALKLRVVRATVLKAAGRTTEALRVIAGCVEEARRASYVRLLVDEGPALAALLRELLARRTADPESRAFIATLLEQLDDETSRCHNGTR